MYQFFRLVAKFFKNRLVTRVQMGTKDEKKWKFSASALGSNGGFCKTRPVGSRVKMFFHSDSRNTPPFGGFEGFWTKSNLGGNVKKKWFHPLPFFKKTSF